MRQSIRCKFHPGRAVSTILDLVKPKTFHPLPHHRGEAKGVTKLTKPAPSPPLKKISGYSTDKCNFHDVAISTMTSQIMKYVDFTETEKSRYLENETLFLLQIKKIINCASRATLWQKIVL